MQIKNLGKECDLWFQVNLETNPPILIVSDPKTQKQEYIFGKLDVFQYFCFDLRKFIKGQTIEIDKYNSVHWYKNRKRHREDGPAIVLADGHKEWWQNGLRHRVDGPAIVWVDGSKFWYKNGNSHREDGPAIVYSDGEKRWYMNNKKFSEQEWAKLVKAKQNAD